MIALPDIQSRTAPKYTDTECSAQFHTQTPFLAGCALSKHKSRCNTGQKGLEYCSVCKTFPHHWSWKELQDSRKINTEVTQVLLCWDPLYLPQKLFFSFPGSIDIITESTAPWPQDFQFCLILKWIISEFLSHLLLSSSGNVLKYKII